MRTKPLSRMDEWRLEHASQDIRGWKVIDADSELLGTVAELLVDTETRRVAYVVLDDGRQLPADSLEIGDDVVFLHASRETEDDRVGGDESHDTHARFAELEPDFRTHCRSTFGDAYETYAPAYRWAYVRARNERNEESDGKGYDEVAATLRTLYEDRFGPNSYPDVEEAIRYAYDRTRKHGR